MQVVSSTLHPLPFSFTSVPTFFFLLFFFFTIHPSFQSSAQISQVLPQVLIPGCTVESQGILKIFMPASQPEPIKTEALGWCWGATGLSSSSPLLGTVSVLILKVPHPWEVLSPRKTGSVIYPTGLWVGVGWDEVSIFPGDSNLQPSSPNTGPHPCSPAFCFHSAHLISKYVSRPAASVSTANLF